MQEREGFGSRFGTLVVIAGSAVGLGNIWRFPYMVGTNGGAAFILIYLFFVLLICLPMLVSKLVIGRRSRKTAFGSLRTLAPGNPIMKYAGYLYLFIPTIVLSYYCVIGGMTVEYFIRALGFSVTSTPATAVIWMLVFLAATGLIVTAGVKNGIERFSKVMMPMLLLIIGILMVCSFSLPGSSAGLAFLLKPDFSKVTPTTFLSAIGQAFFSLSLAMGCLCTYASYFRDDTKLVKTACSVSIIDTMVALLAGFIIFPAVFSVPGVEPEAGPGLVFMSLPYVFTQAFHALPWVGYIFSFLFYVLLFLAALTSAISIHEPVTAYLHEAHHMSRKKAAWCVSFVCMTLGVFCSLSNGILSDFKIFGLTLIDAFDALPAKILLPLGGIIISLFTGWRLDRKLLYDELTNQGTVRFPFFRAYIFLLRWIIPVAIACVFVAELL